MMRSLFIWEHPVDWSYINPIRKHLPGEHFCLRKVGEDKEGKYLTEVGYYKPDNILCFRYGNMISIRKWWPTATTYQFYHGLVDKGFKYVAGQLPKHGELYSYFIESGPYSRDRMISEGGIPQDQVIALGYPKLDSYHWYASHKNLIYKEIGIDPSKKTVVYTPTCREQNSFYSYLQAGFQGEELHKHITKIVPPNVNLLIKFHDRSASMEAKIAEVTNDRIKFIEDYDSIKYLAIADVVLSDCSSVMLEAMACDIPVIQYINNPKNFMQDRCDWWDYTHKVFNLGQLQTAIINALNNPSDRKDQRQVYTKMMFVNLFYSGLFIANFIYDKYLERLK